MRQTCLLAGVAALFAGMAAADSLTYHNDRFDVHGRLPVAVTAEPPPANGDGRNFRSTRNSGRISIYGAYNHMSSLADYRADLAATFRREGEVTYETGGADWFVLSGREAGRIFYLRVVLGTSCSGDPVLGHWRIDYAPGDRPVYDPMLGELSKSLRVGSC